MGRVRRRAFTLVAVVVTAGLMGPTGPFHGAGGGSGPSGTATSVGGRSPAADRDPRLRLADAYRRTPIAFLANGDGNTPTVARIVARGRGYALSVAPDHAALALAGPAGGGGLGTLVRMKVLGGNAAARELLQERLPGTTNFLLGRDPRAWRIGVPSYGRVRYEGVYQGIDLVYHGAQSALEYDFVVAPGADAAVIALGFDGVEEMTIDAVGDLVLSTGAGEIRHRRPVLYQDVQGDRRSVHGGFTLAGGRVGFRVGAYDHARPLVIDPVVGFATYLGGGNDDQGRGIAVDATGNAWVTGLTQSPVFPTTAGAFRAVGDDRALGDAFVTKLRPDGSIAYSTYLGGNDGSDAGLAVDVGDDGAAFVTGVTDSTDLPVTSGAVDATCGTDSACNPVAGSGSRRRRDAFVAKLDPSGSSLAYATYLGGSGAEGPFAVDGERAGLAVGAGGEVVVSGKTESVDFPVTAGAFQTAPAGGGDAFVAKLHPAGQGSSDLVYATYLGGTGTDGAVAVAVEESGASYVTGSTESSDFPVSGALQPARSGASVDAFVAKLDSTGSSLAYSTYLGGSGADTGSGIAIDPAGAAYVTGTTRSTGMATPGAYDTTCGTDGTCNAGPTPVDDAFLTKILPGGSQRAWSTYLGGSGQDAAAAVALWLVGGEAHAVVTGRTTSTDFPLSSPVQAAYGGTGPRLSGGDAFVAEIGPGGTALVHATYLGGTAGDAGTGVGVDSAGNAYVTGASTSLDFPTLNPAQAAQAGGLDGFDAVIAKLVRSASSSPVVAGLQPSSGPAGTPTTVEIAGTGLAGASEVRFGDLVGTVVSARATGITAVAPAQIVGPVDVRVTVGGVVSAPSPFARFAYAEGAWRATAGPMVKDRLRHTATLLRNGRVFVAGGCPGSTAGPCPAPMAGAEVFDPVAATWSPTTPMAGARYGHTATLLATGEVLVAGGNRAGPLRAAELYDPVRNTWRDTQKMSTTRDAHTATMLGNGKVLVVGGDPPVAGDDQRAGRTAESYDPAIGAWTAVASPMFGRVGHTATLLPDGRVLVVGGRVSTCDACPPPPEVYDPVGNSWSPAPNTIGQDRFAHAATLLAGTTATCGTRCGRVLVTGGYVDTNFFRTTASTNLFNPASSWGPARDLPTARASHTASLLPNGKVLVTGGVSGRAGELYEPREGRWISAGSALGHRTGSESTVHTATLLEGDIAVCGSNCGKVVVVGGSEQSAELYTPQPSVASVGPAAAPASGGAGVVITGTGFANSVRAVAFGDRSVPFSVESPTRISVVVPPAPAGTVDVTVVTEGGVSPGVAFRFEAGSSATTPTTTTPSTTPPPQLSAAGGYRLVGSDGGVFAFGAARFAGSTGAIRLNQPMVGMASTPSGGGYWLVARDGGVFAFGDARFLGSTGALRLNQPVVAMAATRSGNGYWLVAADGGVFAFGDARFLGSTGSIRLARPVVAIAATPSGAGYRLVASDGGIFAFGDARFLGSTGALRLNHPVVGVAATPSGAGYWLAAADGGVFAFGDARFGGSTGAIRLNRPIVAIAPASGSGYWLVASDGGIFAFGGAPFNGSAGAVRLSQPIVGMAAGPQLAQ